MRRKENTSIGLWAQMCFLTGGKKIPSVGETIRAARAQKNIFFRVCGQKNTLCGDSLDSLWA